MIHLASSIIPITADDKGVPTRILLIRDGNPGFTGYENVRLTAKGAAQIIDQFETQGNDMFVDYNHAAAMPLNDTNTAKAAGWVRCPGGMEYVPGEGLYVTVDWTVAAAAQIANKEFKYFSPYLRCTDDGEIVKVVNLALTNVPRTRNQTELLAASLQLGDDTKGKSMSKDDKKPTKALTLAEGDVVTPEQVTAVDEVSAAIDSIGAILRDKGVELPPDADAMMILAAVSEMLAGASEPAPAASVAPQLAQVASALGLEKGATVENMITAASSLAVKESNHTELQKRIAALEKDKTDTIVASMIDSEIERGTLNPNDEKALKAARLLAEKNPNEFKTVFASLTPTIEQGQKVRPGDKTPKDSRSKMIAASAHEYFENEGNQGFLSQESWVNAEMKRQGLPVLTSEEVASLTS